jgi:hypothetical protein
VKKTCDTAALAAEAKISRFAAPFSTPTRYLACCRYLRPLGFGRNSLPTPTQVKFDLRVLKFFKVGEHGKLDSVTESFNVFNHANVVSLNQFYSVASSPIPVFATANKGAIPRQLQFSVDLEF